MGTAAGGRTNEENNDGIPVQFFEGVMFIIFLDASK